MARKKKTATKSALMQFDTTKGDYIISDAKISSSEFKAVVYCRVSDPSQVTNGFGLEGQERVCREWCENHNPPLSVDKVYLEP